MDAEPGREVEGEGEDPKEKKGKGGYEGARPYTRL